MNFSGVHLQDLLSIGEGNRNFQKDGRIHWNKFSLMGDVINMICKYQKSSYNIKSNKVIEKFINDTIVMSEDVSFRVKFSYLLFCIITRKTHYVIYLFRNHIINH